MPLLGTGVLAIWNGTEPGAEADFVAWHVREHIPERVRVPGFLRGRRYAALDGHPAYFNFYETETRDALTSPAYVSRLNDPSPWTRQVVARFRDTTRTVCDVAFSRGAGEAGVIETIRLRPGGDPDTFVSRLRTDVLEPLLAAPGIVGTHLLRGRVNESHVDTLEKSLRTQPDQVADWIVLIEAVDASAIRAARLAAASTAALENAGVAAGCQRGLYQLQFSLSHLGA